MKFIRHSGSTDSIVIYMCRLLFRNCNLQLFISYTANHGQRHQAGFNSKMFLKVPTVRRRSLVLFFGIHNSFRHFQAGLSEPPSAVLSLPLVGESNTDVVRRWRRRDAHSNSWAWRVLRRTRSTVVRLYRSYIQYCVYVVTFSLRKNYCARTHSQPNEQPSLHYITLGAYITW